MNLFEDAVLYATILHAGGTRKGTNTPYILHPLEVAQIISTITDDIEVITAGVLHDIVEDTNGTLEDIRGRFGDRVASIVDSETENKYTSMPKEKTWKKRKQESIRRMKGAQDIGVKILWLADKLANIRSIAQTYSERGDETWNIFHQRDPQMHRWYYQTIAEELELDLNKTGAFKEFVKHINFIWPGTFDTEKTKFKKYRVLSPDGMVLIGKGAKGDVYRYDDELIVKVYNEKNMFKDIERENYLARKAFVAGLPTAISFGIVMVGDRYGSMFELINSDSVTNLIGKQPSQLEHYAKIMADIALQIHHTDAGDIDPPAIRTSALEWVAGGVEKLDPDLAQKICSLIETLPERNTLIHGDFHTGNVMRQRDEYLLIDMDRLSVGHPIFELCGLHKSYVALGELDPSVVENYMHFSYDTSLRFFDCFLRYYLETEEQERILEVKNKAALLSYVRMVRTCLRAEDTYGCHYYLKKIQKLLDEIDTLDF